MKRDFKKMSRGSHGLGEQICKTRYLTSIKDKELQQFHNKKTDNPLKNGQKCFGQKYCGFKKSSESGLRGTNLEYHCPGKGSDGLG